jgi:hypothetical protein
MKYFDLRSVARIIFLVASFIPAIAFAASPRFTAVSDAFELVGVLNDKQLTLYLDHFNDGSPVKNATLELELNGVKLDVKPTNAGEFEVLLNTLPEPGSVPIVANITAGNAFDLLAGELAIESVTNATHTEHLVHWQDYVLWVVGAIVLLIAIFLLRIRRSRVSRRPHLGGAA